MRTRSSSAKRLLKLIAGVSMMTLCAAPSVFAAAPYTEFLPTFEVETLTPTSQAALAWKNVAPNALASYYTYQPLTNADAVAVGFPNSTTPSVSNPHGDVCGRVGTATPGTADCYIITVREVIQPMSLEFLKFPFINPVLNGANLFPGPGLISGDGVTPFVDTSTLGSTLATAGGMTKAWGYGSGGLGWRPYGTAVGAPNITGNAPAAFQSTPIGALTSAGSNAFGDPNPNGIWHFPAPTIKGTSNRPVYVQWLNELPNSKPVGIDPSVDCGNNAFHCYPYNRIVTHVHGAHVGPESDGLAVAWYTPNGALFGEGAFSSTLYAQSTNPNSPPVPIYYYPMTQPASTIWYHDHAVGTTHNNTNMGMAGFFPVTDAVEAALQAPTGTPALPVLPTGDVYEVGFALQDRHFDINGQMVFPAVGIYDKNDPNCVMDADNNALPGTCKRLDWMKKIGPVTATDPNPAAHLVPYVLGAPELNIALDPASYALNFPAGCKVNLTNTIENIAGIDPVDGTRVPFTQCAPFPATSATLEYFGNMPVVNGVTYATYDVEPTVYRMRFIGGNDSRTWIAQLIKGNAQPSMVNCGGVDPVTGVAGAPAGCAVYSAGAILPFYQVGSEQGLLTNMVRRTEIDIMDGERIDVLVDFTGLGGQTVTMKNLGDDAPYSGRFDFMDITLRQPTSVSIPEIMKFKVKGYTAPAVPPVSAKTPVDGAPLAGVVLPTITPTKTRTIALIEITDQYGRTMPTVDARGYIPPGIRTTEVIALNAQEQWDIINTTVDAHPMHLHQVAFLAIDRQAIALDAQAVPLPSGFRAGDTYTFGAEAAHDFSDAARLASVFSESQYLPAPGSSPIPVDAWDAGLKDTIQAIPGYVVRVKALYDILGDYVWHCHILSHEEHDMMRPFRVTDQSANGALAAPSSVTVTMLNGIATVTVAPALPVPNPRSLQHVVQYRQVGAPFWVTNAASTSVQNVDLNAAGTGTYEFRAQLVEPALQTVHANTAVDTAFTPGSNVNFGLVITTASPLPSALVNTVVSEIIVATGGAGANSFAVTAGAVPTGLVFYPNGQLYGVPTVPGTFNFTVTVTNGAATFSKAFTMVVVSNLNITTASPLPGGTVGALYSDIITASLGAGGYTYAVTAGTVPAGINFYTNGQLYGVPTAAGVYNFTVTVTDAAAQTVSKAFALTVL